MTESKKQTEDNNWDLFNKRLLSNKRIWKYISLYSLFYFGARQTFDPWYHPKYKPKVSISKPLSNMDTDIQMIQNIIGIGTNSHKPSSNVSLMISQIALCYLYFFKVKPSWKTFAFNSINNRFKSCHPNYTNKDMENHIGDLQIAIWSFLIVIDLFDIIYNRKGKSNSSDKLMLFHHIGTLIIMSNARYHNNQGQFLVHATFWGETVAVLATMAALIRIIYQKKRPDLSVLKYVSNVLFIIHTIIFSYARLWHFVFCYPFDKFKELFDILVMDKYNQYSIPIRTLGLFQFLMLLPGIWWVIQSWRVLFTKLKK
eukprot:121075_1